MIHYFTTMSALRYVCLALTMLVTANAVNPATICYTPKFYTRYFNIITGDNGTVAVDFTKDLYVEISNVTGLKIVHDFVNLKSHAISKDPYGNDTCKTSDLPHSKVMYRCLPPYAKQVHQASGLLGYRSKIQIQTWEVETDYDTVYRVSFVLYSTGSYLPVFLQEFGYHGTVNAYMYLDPTVTISDKNTFDLPDSCTTNDRHVSHVIVG